ncbi:MAG: hypothetical protein ABS897_09295, partial [Eubacteriales bacterium]
ISFMLQKPEELAGVQLTDDQLSMIYGSMVNESADGLVSGSFGWEATETAGTPSRLVWYQCVMNNMILSVSMSVVIIDGQIFTIMYAHPSLSPDKVKEPVRAMSASTRYGGAQTAAEPVQDAFPETDSADYIYPEGSEENPIPLSLTFTADRDTPAAVWMMNADSRAACTVLLLMDHQYFSPEKGSANAPMFDILANPSYVGSADDLIRVVLPVKGMARAIVFLFDAAQDTAAYYYTDWNDEALAGLEEKCTDQFFENDNDRILAYVQNMVQGYDEYVSSQGGE